MTLASLEMFVPNHECPEIRVAWEPEKLCFDSHSRALQNWSGHAHKNMRFEMTLRELTLG